MIYRTSYGFSKIHFNPDSVSKSPPWGLGSSTTSTASVILLNYPPLDDADTVDPVLATNFSLHQLRSIPPDIWEHCHICHRAVQTSDLHARITTWPDELVFQIFRYASVDFDAWFSFPLPRLTETASLEGKRSVGLRLWPPQSDIACLTSLLPCQARDQADVRPSFTHVQSSITTGNQSAAHTVIIQELPLAL